MKSLAAKVLRNATRASVAGTQQNAALCLDAEGAMLFALAGAAQDAEITLQLAAETGSLMLTGHASPIGAGDPGAARFAAFFPTSSAQVHRLDAQNVSFAVSGGGAGSLEPGDLFPAPRLPDGYEVRAVEHMNDDHVDALRDYCRHAGVVCEAGAPVMLTVDPYGFFLRADAGPVRFEFPRPCKKPEDVRSALVDMAKRARGAS